MANSGNRGVSRVLSKLKVSIEEGKYYEAHQMYRTLYFRYCSQKKYDEIFNMLFEGASLLLSHDQQTSGADLALLMLEVLTESKTKPNEDNINKIARLFELLSSSMTERQQYLVKAVKWSSGDIFTQGHPKLHQSLAQILWKEKNYSCARYHFLRSCDGLGCGMMLVEFHLLQGYPSEADLFLTQAVLQYLCLQKKVEATDVFKSYTSGHPNIKQQCGPPYLLPLLNFLWLLLSAIESGKLSHFTFLCEQYRPSLKRDPMYIEYLDKIGEVFFNVPMPRQHTHGGIFSNFLQGLLGGLEDDSDDEMPGPNTQSCNSKPLTSEELD